MNMLQPAQIRYCCAVFFLFVCLVIYRCSGRFFCALIAFLGSIIQLLWLPEHWVQEKSNHMSFAANFYCISYFLLFERILESSNWDFQGFLCVCITYTYTVCQTTYLMLRGVGGKPDKGEDCS